MHKADIFDKSRSVLLMMKHFRFVDNAFSKFKIKIIWILFGVPFLVKNYLIKVKVLRVFNI